LRGVGELADEVYRARARKPVAAVANSVAASAAYWVGSAAAEFYVAPGGEVGSIGVFALHEDWSKALGKQGIATTLVTAGRYKTEQSPYAPLSATARAIFA
jgi:capsid assembly protease